MNTNIPFLITVDVEGVHETDSYNCVDFLDELLSNLQLPATLFVTPAVIEARTELVKRWVAERHAVGLHIHPERLGGDSNWLGQYDLEEIESFLRRGIDVFESHLGERPLLFRAGRWSFSESLLRALAETDFKYDASHRPDRQRDPYTSHDVVEFPLSVYGSWIFRNRLFPWDVETLPLSIDALLANTPRTIACYAATWRVLASGPPYCMVGFHDYDLLSKSVRRRIERYLARVSEFTDPITIDEIEVLPGKQNH